MHWGDTIPSVQHAPVGRRSFSTCSPGNSNLITSPGAYRRPDEAVTKRKPCINARVEKALTGRYFRHMFSEGRVIIPTGGWYEWLRHEVACVIVRRSHPAEPAVPSAVPYEVWRSGNGPSKSPRTMQPPSQDGCRNRERTACLPASRWVGARVDGMVSVSEPH